ncbi:uncharacterized protein DFL_003353 [Arthrobotrys flagrans]|uniref:ubiquitinyl hydrolase 1 n=1 Tax=Arthrobotrys flagrans TaxID=97331 RepID=A0A437A1S4_ARTFL|nr:hypothetical protein DFL_003353 [Arthrobotrys flagrans]
MLVDTATSTGPPRQGPGKTSPRLYADILTYDPRNQGFNVLSSFPPEDDSEAAQKLYQRSGHSHRFVLKPNQSTPRSYPVESGATHIIAAVCQSCRQHVEVRLRYADDAPIASICPTAQNHLHHFRYDHVSSGPFIDKDKKEETSGELDVRHFDCTNAGCKTSVTVTFKNHRITRRFQTLLTDTKILWNRNKQAFERYPESFIDPKAPEGGRIPVQKPVPTPAMVLKTMKTVIGGVTARKERRSIPRLNTRFLTHLGDECHEMMEILGFVLDEDQASVPPILPDEPGNGIPLQDELAKVFDDWDLELTILLALNDIDASFFQPINAEADLKKLLAAANYPTNPASRRIADPTLPEHPMYASLGANWDFSDNLLFWAYQRQKECDPENAPFYFDCISELATGRRSEDLLLQVVTLRSQGEFSRSDVKNAYHRLGITTDFDNESFIIGNFQSRLSDAPRQEMELREGLMTIGKYLKNENIMNASKKVAMGLRQAYDILGMGVGSDVDADFVASIFQYQLNENSNDATNLWAALRVIADNRKDHRLLSMCDAHDQGLELMDYETALLRLRVNGQMSDDTIVQYYEGGLTQNNRTSLKSALQVIADKRQSRALDHYIKTGSKLLFTNGMADWPVGLENTGNTCYLNSLLQYYFTIKPLRDVILDFDNHEEDDVTEELLQRKQVGGRKVTTTEIERAKKLTHGLKGLFRDMVTSKQTYVRPEREISELALNSANHEVSARKRSVAFAEDGRPAGFIGPMLPPGAVFEDEEPLPFSMDIDEKPPRLRVTNADDQSSDITLVGDNQEPPAYEDQGYVVVDGQPGATGPDADVKGEEKPVENEKSGPTIHAPTPKAGKGISALDAMNLDDDNDSTVPLLQREAEDEDMEDAPVPPTVPERDGMRVMPPIPERPPPIPPRPKEKAASVAASAVSAPQSFEFGRQQDVTECIENVMFQLEAALKAEGTEADGEQLDIIKTLFYGKTRQTLEFSAPAETRDKEERFANLMIDVGEVGRDIYAAMDGHFDASIVELEGKLARRYLSITALPSILQIQIQRVQFNRATKSSYKSNAPLTFGERIFLDRYMASGDDKGLMARREQSWKWKAELEKLEKRKADLEEEAEGLKISMALEATKGYLDEINNIFGEDEEMVVVPSSLLVELEDHKERVGGELRYINDRIKELQSNLNQQFTDLRKYGYRIHSIFMHRGSVNFGHYWIYIYDHHNKIWRNYNDTTVSKAVDEEEIFRGKSKDGGSDGGPYFLVYVREDRLDWMQALCRDLGAGRKSEGVAVDEGKGKDDVVAMDIGGFEEGLKGG